MFIKKGTTLVLKSKEELNKDSSIKVIPWGFEKDDVYLTFEMLKQKHITLSKDCEINNGFESFGWTWYDWMFDLSDFRKFMFLKSE